MSDQDQEHLILGHIEGELTPEEERQFQAELSRDARLRHLVAQLRADRELLRQAPPEPPPPALQEQITLMLERQVLLGDDPAPSRANASNLSRPIRGWRLTGYLAAAAVLALGLGLLTLYALLPGNRLINRTTELAMNRPAETAVPPATPAARPAPAQPRIEAFAARDQEPAGTPAARPAAPAPMGPEDQRVQAAPATRAIPSSEALALREQAQERGDLDPMDRRAMRESPTRAEPYPQVREEAPAVQGGGGAGPQRIQEGQYRQPQRPLAGTTSEMTEPAPQRVAGWGVESDDPGGEAASRYRRQDAELWQDGLAGNAVTGMAYDRGSGREDGAGSLGWADGHSGSMQAPSSKPAEGEDEAAQITRMALADGIWLKDEVSSLPLDGQRSTAGERHLAAEAEESRPAVGEAMSKVAGPPAPAPTPTATALWVEVAADQAALARRKVQAWGIGHDADQVTVRGTVSPPAGPDPLESAGTRADQTVVTGGRQATLRRSLPASPAAAQPPSSASAPPLDTPRDAPPDAPGEEAPVAERRRRAADDIPAPAPGEPDPAQARQAPQTAGGWGGAADRLGDPYGLNLEGLPPSAAPPIRLRLRDPRQVQALLDYLRGQGLSVKVGGAPVVNGFDLEAAPWARVVDMDRLLGATGSSPASVDHEKPLAAEPVEVEVWFFASDPSRDAPAQ